MLAVVPQVPVQLRPPERLPRLGVGRVAPAVKLLTSLPSASSRTHCPWRVKRTSSPPRSFRAAMTSLVARGIVFTSLPGPPQFEAVVKGEAVVLLDPVT